jgi:hypothetical protein
LAVLGMKPGEERCVYCGKESSGLDHLRPLVEGGRPTGYITEIANLVPCCGRCNSRKGNASWRDWMSRRRDSLKTAVDIEEHERRIACLEAYEKRWTPRHVDFRKFVEPEEWDRYWSMYDAVLTELADCHSFACKIRHRANESLGVTPKKTKSSKGSMPGKSEPAPENKSSRNSSPRRGAGL